MVAYWDQNTGKKKKKWKDEPACQHSFAAYNLHKSKMLDSAGSASFEASFVIVTKLAFERVSMAECIMGSQTSSMFGITNIFCWKKNTVAQK